MYSGWAKRALFLATREPMHSLSSTSALLAAYFRSGGRHARSWRSTLLNWSANNENVQMSRFVYRPHFSYGGEGGGLVEVKTGRVHVERR